MQSSSTVVVQLSSALAAHLTGALGAQMGRGEEPDLCHVTDTKHAAEEPLPVEKSPVTSSAAVHRKQGLHW